MSQDQVSREYEPSEASFSGKQLAEELTGEIGQTAEATATGERVTEAMIPWRLEMPEHLDFEGRKKVLAEEVERRVSDAGFDKLAALYGETLPTDDPEARLAALRDLAARQWDFRKGKMRYDTDFAAVLPDETVVDLEDPVIKRAVEEAAGGFGMVESSHASRSEYDGLIEPGGAGQTPLLRLKHALEQKGPDSNPVKYGWIALLGSDRVVSDAERAKVQNYAPEAKTEFDLMAAAAEKLLEVEPLRDAKLLSVGYEYNHDSTPHVRYYRTSDGTSVFVLNAPIPEGDSKANTGHTYDLLRSVVGKRLSTGKNVLLSSIAYVGAFQHVDAERLLGLPTGVSVETIGYSKDYSLHGTDDPPEGTESSRRPPKELLQEIKSYVDSIGGLKTATEEAQESESASRA